MVIASATTGAASSAPTKANNERGSGRGELRPYDTQRGGFSGRSVLCAYGNLVRRFGWDLPLRESQKSRRDAGATKGEPCALELMTRTDRPGLRFSGHSMLCPYKTGHRIAAADAGQRGDDC